MMAGYQHAAAGDDFNRSVQYFFTAAQLSYASVSAEKNYTTMNANNGTGNM
jgi:hypothetical protein